MIEWDDTPAFRQAYHSQERRRWVQNQRSIVSGGWPCVNAHVKPDVGLPVGTSRKGSYEWVVPMTAAEHQQMHATGEDTYASQHDLDLAEEARRTHRRWLRYTGAR